MYICIYFFPIYFIFYHTDEAQSLALYTNYQQPPENNESCENNEYFNVTDILDTEGRDCTSFIMSPDDQPSEKSTVVMQQPGNI